VKEEKRYQNEEIDRISKFYIKTGVNLKDAPVLALLELLSGIRLRKIETPEDEYSSDKYDIPHKMNHFKLNKTGNIVRIFFYSIEPLIKLIPEQICSLQYLEELHLKNNLINSIPKKIGNLRSLKILDLSNNKISRIPKSIRKLEMLEELYLYGTQIKKIPNFLIRHPLLEKIDIFNNLIFREKHKDYFRNSRN